jgi:hypothetical protein
MQDLFVVSISKNRKLDSCKSKRSNYPQHLFCLMMSTCCFQDKRRNSPQYKELQAQARPHKAQHTTIWQNKQPNCRQNKCTRSPSTKEAPNLLDKSKAGSVSLQQIKNRNKIIFLFEKPENSVELLLQKHCAECSFQSWSIRLPLSETLLNQADNTRKRAA